jgi:hypothetical protein
MIATQPAPNSLTPTPIASMNPYLKALVAAKGDINRAAEDLSVSVEDVALALVANPQELQRVTRAVQLIQLFDLTNIASKLLLQRMPELRPDDLAKTYLGQVALIEKLTDEKTANILQQNNTVLSLEQTVIDALPQDIREAVLFLTKDNANIVEHDAA